MLEYNSIPVEVIDIILKVSSVSDRKCASLICKRWRASFWHHAIVSDCELVLQSLQQIGTNFLRNNVRYFKALRVDEVSVSQSATWQLYKAVPNLHLNISSLSLRGSQISECDLYFLLSRCFDLHELDLADIRCSFSVLNGLEIADGASSSAPASGPVATLLANALRQLSTLRKLTLAKCTDLRTNGVLRLLRSVSTSLLELDLSDVRFASDDGHVELGRPISARSRKQLDFEPIAETLGKCGKLRVLRLARTNVVDQHMDELLEQLTLGEIVLAELCLSGCTLLTDSVAAVVGSQRRLCRLEVGACRDLSWTTLAAIGSRDTLTHLGIGKLPQMSVKDLGRLSRHRSTLRQLDLSECGLQRALTLVLAPQAGPVSRLLLHTLSLKGVGVTDEEFDQIVTNLKHLVHLNVGSCFKLTDAAFRMIGRLPKLRTLNLSHCTVSTWTLGSELLVELDLSYCNRLTSASFQSLTNCRFLRRLNLSGSLARDYAFTCVARVASLEQLELQSCPNVTDQDLRNLCAALPRLRSLNLQHCETISDSALNAIQLCKRLRELNLSFCPKVTSDAVNDLRACMPNVKTLKSSFD